MSATRQLHGVCTAQCCRAKWCECTPYAKAAGATLHSALHQRNGVATLSSCAAAPAPSATAVAVTLQVQLLLAATVAAGLQLHAATASVSKHFAAQRITPLPWSFVLSAWPVVNLPCSAPSCIKGRTCHSSVLAIANELGQCHEGSCLGWLKAIQLLDSFHNEPLCHLP